MVYVMAMVLCCGTAAFGHDFERTTVTLTFARDGSFVLDVTNDAIWLEHRLIPFRDGVIAPSFADRIVLFVDGREVRPSSVELRTAQPPLATWRMRGHVPATAQTLRWYYGLPIDPYPLTIRRADGRIIVEEIGGDSWSQPVDISGQFSGPPISSTAVGGAIAALLIIPIVLRLAWSRKPAASSVDL
ncbi:MAG TPA: hypothetical protein VKE96_26380 [Vicinamibacterales bacterium]|nr:hypothetical protein [Vicinamibacterales bacterium]